MISQVAAGSEAASAPPFLLAVVRPPPFPNVAPGNEPGCVALYRSEDNGLTWTISFSATAEAPVAVALAPTGSVYLLTQRLQFPLYLAGNMYRSDAEGEAWTWSRVSPQGRHDVPMVSATDMLVQDDGSVILREGNGDGAALIVSRDGGDTWQPVVIPRLLSVGSVTSLGLLIAVAPPLLAPGRSPGMVSSDHGLTWRAMGSLPGAPSRADLRPLLSASSSEHALIMDLVPAGQGGPVRAAARFVSLDGGRHWTRVMCAARPSPGCADSTRWAEAAGERYVLYRRQIFFAPAGHPWLLVTAQLPVPSDTVQQLLAVPARPHAVLYLVAASGIWRWQDGGWHPSSTGLPLGGPTPTQG